MLLTSPSMRMLLSQEEGSEEEDIICQEPEAHIEEAQEGQEVYGKGKSCLHIQV